MVSRISFMSTKENFQRKIKGNPPYEIWKRLTHVRRLLCCAGRRGASVCARQREIIKKTSIC